MSVLRVGVYVRVSTREQTTENQLLEIRRHAERRPDWRIVREYDDSGVSGTRRDRPAFDEMMADAVAGRLDLVATYAVDRLGRSTIDLLNALNALQAAGVGYCATSQGIDTTTAAGRMLASFLSVLAQWEREVIVGRVVSGLQRARANGVALGRPRVAVDIRRAVALRATGMGYKQVAKALGIPRTTLYRTLSAIPQTPVAAAG